MQSTLALMIFFLVRSAVGTPVIPVPGGALAEDEYMSFTSIPVPHIPTDIPNVGSCSPPPCKPWPFGYEEA
ncbi:uncharacterized protein BDR25DRAFT_13991 [Lindgomyces ingoldianus]|uniref:Uncharacterized protein n=1 Tax=Lindgomyces ingoldianus TaxID=673940 RepID=A0ACB6QZA0_9PLEO|nr:uncharacterized protein BDR25DRAFT_13991 [Lindgomyces ingoldianus]KAF2472384.1 hypothetical protein BDR25DRAFT_13991 [Lindgomyces ingoldianus]